VQTANDETEQAVNNKASKKIEGQKEATRYHLSVFPHSIFIND